MTGGVCVERKLLSARASLGMPELQKQTGRVQTLLEVLITQRNAQVQTLCSSQSQQAPALFDAFAGVNAADRLLRARVCCIWVSHGK